ncbi:hypothetical protein, partial [Mycobacteroides abscessus]|uniref:hypothetical protein n=1 Tax=Mycobacteroides abscessus TaxID=36809 RepID=UPI0013FD0456
MGDLFVPLCQHFGQGSVLGAEFGGSPALGLKVCALKLQQVLPVGVVSGGRRRRPRILGTQVVLKVVGEKKPGLATLASGDLALFGSNLVVAPGQVCGPTRGTVSELSGVRG